MYECYPITFSLLPESFRWMRVSGKTEEAENVLKRIAKKNKKDWPVNVKLAPTSVKDKKSESAKYLFFPFKMAISTFIQMFAWCVQVF